MRNKRVASFLAVLLIPSAEIAYSSYASAKNEVREQIRNSSIDTMKLTRTNIGQYLLPVMNNLDEYVQIFTSDTASTQDQAQPILDTIFGTHPEINSIIIGNEDEAGKYINTP